MSEITVNGVSLFYEEKGSGTETIVFSHSYLVDNTHFAPQIEALSDRYRCIAYDHRGHGRSQAPKDGYDMENLLPMLFPLSRPLTVHPAILWGILSEGLSACGLAFGGQNCSVRSF